MARVAFAVEGARGADAAVLAAVLPLHAHVHPCKTERASERPTGTPDARGLWLQHQPVPTAEATGMTRMAPALPAPALTH